LSTTLHINNKKNPKRAWQRTGKNQKRKKKNKPEVGRSDEKKTNVEAEPWKVERGKL
jgi:hypothetical protein